MAGNTKSFVVDSSAVAAVLLPDEKKSPFALKLIKIIESGSLLMAPQLLQFEVGNCLKSAVMSKRITKKEAEILFFTFENMQILLEPIDKVETLKISVDKNLSFYDASYLYLAKTNKCKLLTLDKILSEKA
jgi:predicted nucleic acid-binding protein